MNLNLSPLRKTWIFDLDGTLLVHNGYIFGGDELLPGVKEFFAKIPPEDYILILTAREVEVKDKTVKFLRDNGIRFNKIIFDVPTGERILLNDDKPTGLQTSYAVRLKRDGGLGDLSFTIDENL